MSEQPSQTPQAVFKSTLLTVVGQAFGAAGFQLEDRPVQHAGGKFRFVRPMDNQLQLVIAFQLLAYVETEWAARMRSRFRVTLLRTQAAATDGVDQRSASLEPVSRDLGTLIVEDFGVAILPSGNHWWTFMTMDEMGKALGEAGRLIIGYGIPWLLGDLTPGVDGGLPSV